MDEKQDSPLINWEQCCKYILSKNENGFYRNEHTINASNKFISILNTKYDTIQDGILTEYFKSSTNSDYALIKDDFAFNFSTNITQYIFISTSETYNNYNTLHKIIKTDLKLSKDDTNYIFGSFSRNFISQFYPFLKDFVCVEIIFVKNTDNQIKYSDPPTCEQFIIWEECIQFINEEWFYKFWYKYNNNSLQKIQQIISSQINNPIYDMTIFTPFENPFYLFNGIYHYIFLSSHDIVANHSKSELDNIIYKEIQKDKNCKFEDEHKNDLLYFEERNNIQFIKPFIDEQITLLSDLFSEDSFKNIFHVFIKNDADYFDGIEYIKRFQEPLGYTWDELVTIVRNGELQKLGRDERWARTYMLGRQEYIKHFKNTGAMILINRFQSGSKFMDTQNNNWKLEGVINENTPKMIWTINDYPYRYFDGIEHNLLWYLNDCGDEDNTETWSFQDDFIPFIEKHVKPNYIYEIYINPPNLRTVPELNHIHIISVNLKQYYLKGCGMLKVIEKAYEWNVFYDNDDIRHKHYYDGTFGRDERMCRKYYKYLSENDKIYETRRDLILHQLFGYDVAYNQNSGKLCSVVGSNVLDVNVRYKMVENKFGYNVCTAIKQYVIFCLESDVLSNKEIESVVEQRLNIKTNEYVYWKPDENCKTISDLFYWHVSVFQK